MKNKFYVILVALILQSTFLHSQKIYFKVGGNYHISSTTQKMPEYFDYTVNIRPSGGISTLPVNLQVDEFSVASGISFQGGIGYSLNDFLSTELRFSTFSNTKKEFKASPELQTMPNGITNWELRQYNLFPTILFGKSFGRSAINIFVYAGFGLSKLTIKVSQTITNFDDFRKYEFSNSSSFSWGYGIEYSYSLGKKMSLFTNIGINSTYYKPVKAQLESSSAPIAYFTTSQKEIKYVDEIENLELDYNGKNKSDIPETRLKETLKLSSIYLGVGIKYTLKK
jgi:hypothetical protein